MEVYRRKQLDTALAAAEANCRRANDAFDKAAADMAKAIVDWNLATTDRLKGGADINALSKLVADRQDAYAAKSNAEAEWGKAESILRQAEHEWEKAQTRFNEATAKRNKIVAALGESAAWEIRPRPSKSSGRWIEGLEKVFRPAKTPATYATHLGERGARPASRSSQDLSARREPIHEARTGVSAHHPEIGNSLAKTPLPRQAIGLLCLTLAFLQYYFLDIQLQIMSLPSVAIVLSQ